MSRIFDAIKRAQLACTGTTPPNAPASGGVEIPDRRRSRRWMLDASVFVYGHGPEKEPFHAEARTLNVNANGALLLLTAPVRLGQKLLLTNRLTEKDQDCHVIFVGTKHVEAIEAGIAFPEANPDFWQSMSAPEKEPEPAA